MNNEKYEGKIWKLVQYIYEKSQITSSNDYIRIEPEALAPFYHEFHLLIKKLSQDNELFKIHSIEYRSKNSYDPYDYDRNLTINQVEKEDPQCVEYLIELSNKFPPYYKKLADKFDKRTKIMKKEDIIYELSFNEETDQLLLNNIVIHTPVYGKDSNKLIRYLINNPNQDLKTQDVIKNAELESKRDISGIINDLGFKDKSKKLFFTINKEIIKFTNPITKNHLEKTHFGLLTILDFKK